MAVQSNIARIESFPFDSKSDGYDSDGYPVYDRAVGALMLRSTFSKFFSDGVFPSPSDAMEITKGDDGLNVTIKPGVFIIKGAMGAVVDEGLTLSLDASAPQGNIAYGVMVRYDENDTAGTGRSLSIRIVRGDASSVPAPPQPDQSTPGVYEYRLGYVTVPSGATDLTGATVTNEKGLAACPYAAPFVDLDLSAVVDDARQQAQDATDAFRVYVQQYYDLVASAIDGTTAGELMGMINAISPQSFVDNITLDLTAENKMRIKDRGVTDSKIAIYSIHQEHLDNFLRQKLGLLDTSTWDFSQYYSYVQGLADDTSKDEFVQGNIDASTISTWTGAQVVQMENILPNTSAKYLCDLVDLNARTWSDVKTIANGVRSNSISGWVGRDKNADVSGFGTVPMRIIGVHTLTKTSGGTAPLTFMAWKECGHFDMESPGSAGNDYDTIGYKSYIENTVMAALPSDLQSCLETVEREYVVYSNQGTPSTPVVHDFTAKLFALAIYDVVPQGTTLRFLSNNYGMLATNCVGPSPQQQYYAGVEAGANADVLSDVRFTLSNTDATNEVGKERTGWIMMLCDSDRTGKFAIFDKNVKLGGGPIARFTNASGGFSENVVCVNPVFCI